MNLALEMHASGQEFLASLDPSRSGCVVVELSAPGDGLRVQNHLKNSGISMPVIFVAKRAEVSLAIEAMRRGAVHFFEKPLRTHEFGAAIREAIELDVLCRQETELQQEIEGQLARITGRQQEVLTLVGKGKSKHEIAHELGVCLRTVEMHLAGLKKNLGLPSLQELMDAAILVNDKALRSSRPRSRPGQVKD
jgi:FixJ family two-component response regulator